MSRLSVVMTGAAGVIGSHLIEAFAGRYHLRGVDLRPVRGADESVTADITDAKAMRVACEGADVVLHMAANRNNMACFDELLQPNIVGLTRVFQAACDAGVRRLIFASSCHAVMAYPDDAGVSDTDLPNPPDVYGATKVYGEVLGRYFHTQHGMEFIGVRIGAFQPPDKKWLREGKGEARSLWLSPRDATQLFQKAIETPGIGYAIVNATSVNNPQWLSLEPARRILGYEPLDDVDKLPPLPG